MKPATTSRQYFASLIVFLLQMPQSKAAIDCNHPEGFIVNSQDDVAPIIACGMASLGSINGNVTIGTSTSGAIEFRNFGLLNGSITARNNPLLTSLAFVSDDPHAKISGFTRQIDVHNLSALTSFSYPLLTRTGDAVIFEDLPSLRVLNFSQLRFASGIRLRNLPQLETLLLSQNLFGVVDDIEVKDVGIQDINTLFNIGLEAKTIAIDGIPNVKKIRFSLADSQSVTINGDGEQGLIFDCSNCEGDSNSLRKILVDSLTISGLNSVSSNRSFEAHGDDLFLQVRALNAIGNTFTHLPLDFSNLTSLHIINNTNLRTLSYNIMFPDYPWTDIVITGNPNLLLNSSLGRTDMQWKESLTPLWRWPNHDVINMTFGGPFDNAFFQPFIDLGDGKGPRKRPKVLQRFIVDSTVKNFSCTGLDSLRVSGVLLGEYSCQNQTIGVSNGASKLGGSMSLSFFCAVWAIAVLAGHLA